MLHIPKGIYIGLYTGVNLPSGYHHQCQHEKGQNDRCIFNSADCQHEETEVKKLIRIIQLRWWGI